MDGQPADEGRLITAEVKIKLLLIYVELHSIFKYITALRESEYGVFTIQEI